MESLTYNSGPSKDFDSDLTEGSPFIKSALSILTSPKQLLPPPIPATEVSNIMTGGAHMINQGLAQAAPPAVPPVQ